MKKEILEYHPNGNIKHKITYYPNGNKHYEQFYDLQENFHRKPGLPDYQSWFKNGISSFKTYHVHGRYYNINNPASINFDFNGKIWRKIHNIKSRNYSKLNWLNIIKNI